MLKIPNVKSIIAGLFPILKWSRHYDLDKALGDLIAGITVALTLIPQSMAYALLAGFDPQYGLYGSFMGGFVYAVMGTCPQINIGPSALIALLTFTYTNGTNVDFGIFLCLVTGIVQVVAGLTQLGCLVEFVSAPVVSGFTSAAAFTVASSQIKGLLGLRFKANTFISTWKCVFQHIGETSWPDTVLSVVCCITLVGMQALKNIPIKKPQDKDGLRRAAIKARMLWVLSVSRNAVVVALASVVAFIFHVDVNQPLRVTGEITPGLPNPQPPPFKTTLEDKLYTAGDMLLHLDTGIIVVPFVGILTNVAIVKAFAKDMSMNATQEIIALGVCNIVSSFFRSIPVNGSLSRSAVSQASGVRTPAASIYIGVLVILTLLLLTPYFYYIPRAALASVIVCAVLGMVDIPTCRKVWKTNKIDLLPLIGCFICCLAVGIQLGLVCGIVIDLLLIIFYNSRPPFDVQYVDNGTLPPHFEIYPVGKLHFASAEKIRSKLLALKHPKFDDDSSETRATSGNITRKNAEEKNSTRATAPLVVYSDGLHRIDYTFLQALKQVVEDWSHSSKVIWCNARPAVKTQLNNTMPNLIYCERDQLKSLLSNNNDELTDGRSPSEPGPSRRD